MGRGTTIFFMAVSAAWAPVVGQFQTLFEYLQSALAYLVPPVVAIFILGLFWRRASGTGALVGLAAGHVFSLGTLVLQGLGVFPTVHFLILAGVFFGAAALAVVIASLLSQPPTREQVNRFVWSRESMAAATAGLAPEPWYKDYRLHSVALLVLTTWLVVAYW